MASSPLSIPPELKKISAFLRRAEELDHDRTRPESRVVAYQCRQYAVQAGIPLASAAADPTAARKCLSELLGELEGEKRAMAAFSRDERRAVCRTFAEGVLAKADGEDRAGAADKGTARTFYAAGTFFEILQQFYDGEELLAMELPEEGESDDITKKREEKEEEDRKRVYCKWKATEIFNAIKEGRTPESGGYNQNGENDEGNDVGEDGGSSFSTGGVEVSRDSLPPAAGSPLPSTEFPPLSAREPSPPPLISPPAVSYPPPPPYDGIELNLNGIPSSAADDDEDDDDDDEIFIPGARKGAFAETPVPSPPPFESVAPVPPPPAAAPAPTIPHSPPSSSSVGGRVSGLFHRMGGGNTKKLPKETMGDAVELTKFALAALQNGEAGLGAERLRQALGVLEQRQDGR